MKVFLDSSAFAKRYVQEKGSNEVNLLLEETTECFISLLCVLEVHSALCRLLREKKVSSGIFKRLKGALIGDVRNTTIIGLDEVVVPHVILCLERTALRTLDAIQVSSALTSRCDLFVSADLKQCAAARSLGLNIRVV